MIDPITREIVQSGLSAAADEMANTVYRTAYSTIVRDCLDYSTSLCDARGEMIAQGVTIPFHLGSVPFAMEALLAKFDEDMYPGDLFILNDPFEGGMHIPAIGFEGELGREMGNRIFGGGSGNGGDRAGHGRDPWLDVICDPVLARRRRACNWQE